MTDDSTNFEVKRVRVVRGLEARTIAKWEKQGWSFVSESREGLRTSISFRRPKPDATKKQLQALAALGVIVASLFALNLLPDDETDDSAASPVATPSSSTTSDTGAQVASAKKEEVPVSAGEEEDEAPTITAKNNAEFASMLKLTDYCDESIERFANKYRGRVIGLEASIGAMNNHGNYKTRYDILLSPGPFSETESYGPAFQFRDENTVNDLHYVGDVPDTVGVGSHLYIKAEVKEFEQPSCLFLLEPVETSFL